MNKVLYLSLLALVDLFVLIFIFGSPNYTALYFGGPILIVSIVVSIFIILSKPKKYYKDNF